MRANHLRDDAAPVDAAGQDHRQIRCFGKAHIGDVAFAQIDLGRAARAFDQDDIGIVREAFEAFEHALQKGRFQLCIIAGHDGRQPLAVDDNLSALFGFRL